MQLGININPKAMRYFGLDEKKTIQKVLSLPFSRVRVAIPFDEVLSSKSDFDFSKTDYLIDQAIEKKKTIDLQLGIKTIGWPEFHIPLWLSKQFPTLLSKREQIDKNDFVQGLIFEYLEQTTKRYLKYKQIGTIQVENEAFSKRLEVTNYRYLSTDFHKKETAVIQKQNKLKRPLVQNLPLDTP